VVAVSGNRVVGIAVGRAAHEQGWIVFFSTLSEYRRQGIGSQLLAALEARMAPLGLTKLSILVPDGQHDSNVLDRAGFTDRNHLSYFEREIPVSEKERAILGDLGGPGFGGRPLGRYRGDAAGKGASGTAPCFTALRRGFGRKVWRGATAIDCAFWPTRNR
jgi:hypothetical protein